MATQVLPERARAATAAPEGELTAFGGADPEVQRGVVPRGLAAERGGVR